LGGRSTRAGMDVVWKREIIFPTSHNNNIMMIIMKSNNNSIIKDERADI
jgi:hypothetical protein